MTEAVQLEHATLRIDSQTEVGAIMISQALSLKRIADSLEKLSQLHTTDIQNAVTHLAWEAGRSFQQGTRTDR